MSIYYLKEVNSFSGYVKHRINLLRRIEISGWNVLIYLGTNEFAQMQYLRLNRPHLGVHTRTHFGVLNVSVCGFN